MTLLGLFAEAEHRGFGNGYDGRAHGYGLLLVRCESEGDLADVRHTIMTSKWGEGYLDFIATIAGDFVANAQGGHAGASYGDYRSFRVVDAADILTVQKQP